MSVAVYKRGPFCCSVCAPEHMTGEEVAREVEAGSPAGTGAGWTISTNPTFATGQPNPCPCEQTPGRRHWLLDA